MNLDTILHGNCIETLKTIPDESIDCCITSPPYYGLRDYGVAEQIGLEETPEEYIDKLVSVFREVKRILKPEGTLWVNIGDSYVAKPKSNYDGKGKSLNDISYGTGDTLLGYKQSADKFKKLLSTYKNKDLIGIPWLLAFALRNDGWYLRQDIIWHKPNPMPESVKDRCTKSHEYIFLLSKSPKYYFDYEAIQEPANYKDATGIKFGGTKYGDNGDTKFATYSGNEYQSDGTRNKRDVWSVIPSHYKEAHFATFPEELVTPMLLAGCPKNGVVLDPFMGSGTTAAVAILNKRHYIGCELNKEYIEMANRRIADAVKIANQVTFDDLFSDNQTTFDDILKGEI